MGSVELFDVGKVLPSAMNALTALMSSTMLRMLLENSSRREMMLNTRTTLRKTKRTTDAKSDQRSDEGEGAELTAVSLACACSSHDTRENEEETSMCEV